MQELTSKEIEIYNNLPFKIRQILSHSIDKLLWRKSKYGMGYKLDFPRTSIKPWIQPNTPISDMWPNTPISDMWITTSTPYSISTSNTGTYTTTPSMTSTPSLTVNPEYSHYGFPQLTKQNDENNWGIPYFADDIISAAEDIVITFLNLVNTDKNDLNTYTINSEEYFAFSVSGEANLIGSLTIEGETFEIVCDSDESFRTLALRAIDQVGKYLAANYKPSVTDLNDIVNIVKVGKDQRAIVLKNDYMAHRILNNYPHCLFVSEDGETINFVEGKFRVFASVQKMSMQKNI